MKEKIYQSLIELTNGKTSSKLLKTVCNNQHLVKSLFVVIVKYTELI